MSLRGALQGIYETHGQLTPRLVVDEARDPGHELHDHFEWDDAVAGDAWRCQQARALIRSVRISYTADDGATGSVRAYHSVTDNEEVRVFREVHDVIEDPVALQVLLADMRREWAQLKRRWQHFEQFAEMVRGDIADVA
jgi:hypothetical protein